MKNRGNRLLPIVPIIFLLILEFESRADKISEQRMRMIRARFQFGVELATDKPRVQIFIQLDNLNQAVIRQDARNYHAV